MPSQTPGAGRTDSEKSLSQTALVCSRAVQPQGPSFSLAEEDLDRLADSYAQPGAFTSSIGWYRAGSGTVATSLAERAPDPAERIRPPARVLWPAHDPLFPPAWGERLGEFFADVTVVHLPDAGHFVPLEAPEAVASAVREMLAGTPAAG